MTGGLEGDMFMGPKAEVSIFCKTHLFAVIHHFTRYIYVCAGAQRTAEYQVPDRGNVHRHLSDYIGPVERLWYVVCVLPSCVAWNSDGLE